MDNQETLSKTSPSNTLLTTEAANKTEVEQVLTNQLNAFSNTLIHVMKEVSVIADKRLSVFLLALGTTFLFLIIFLRLKPLGLQVSELTSVEFIVLVLVSFLLLSAGVYLQFYQYQKEREITRSVAETGTRIIERNMETSARIQEKSFEAGVNLANASTQQPRGF